MGSESLGTVTVRGSGVPGRELLSCSLEMAPRSPRTQGRPVSRGLAWSGRRAPGLLVAHAGCSLSPGQTGRELNRAIRI